MSGWPTQSPIYSQEEGFVEEYDIMRIWGCFPVRLYIYGEFFNLSNYFMTSLNVFPPSNTLQTPGTLLLLSDFWFYWLFFFFFVILFHLLDAINFILKEKSKECQNCQKIKKMFVFFAYYFHHIIKKYLHLKSHFINEMMLFIITFTSSVSVSIMQYSFLNLSYKFRRT